MKPHYICFLAVLLFTAQLSSQDKRLFSLDDCIRVAENNNSQILALQEDLKISEANYKIAGSENLPSVSLAVRSEQIENEGVGTNEVPIPGVDTKYGVVAGLNSGYYIYKPGRKESIGNSRRALEITRLVQDKRYKAAIKSVKDAYFGYILSQKELKLKKASLERYTIIYRKMSIFAGAGQESPVAVSNWEVTLANSNLAYEQAEQKAKQSRADIFLQMGMEDTGEIEFEAANLDELPEIALSLEELQLLAVTHSPDIKAAEISEMNSKANVQSAKDQRNPNLSVFANLGYQNNVVTDSGVPVDKRLSGKYWDPGFAVGLTSSMPLYTGGAIPANIEKSKAQYNKSRYETKNVMLQVKSNVKSMHATLAFYKSQIEINRKNIITAKSNLRIVERNYESGMSKAEDVLDATESLYNAEMGFLSAKIGYIQLVSSLANLIGVEEEFICQKSK